MKILRLIGNVLWAITFGLALALGFIVLAVLYCITIIGIPYGVQLFKIAALVAWPFGKTIKTYFGKHPILNIIWAIAFGWEFASIFLLLGLIFFVTIIGIPFGKQCIKMSELAFIPFGATF